MRIGVASDHAGYLLKPMIVDYIKELGYDVEDFGPENADRVDYPDYALKLSKAVVDSQVDLGILICGTGIGMSIAANKVKGVRCAAVSETYSAAKARQHNNANILAIGSRVVGPDVAKDLVKAFLEAEFEGGRHQNRLDIISKYEAEHM